jgi:predicted house-cleaning noncanonical NTP pyrophosphatase (MazG superfamily)
MILRFRVEKLIRDRLPEIMRSQGLAVFEHRLALDDFKSELKLKLVEEASEAASCSSSMELVEELADVLEVLMALAKASGITLPDVEAMRLKKRVERGGFEGRIYNAAVEAESNTQAVAYYLDRPEQYPQIPRQMGRFDD